MTAASTSKPEAEPSSAAAPAERQLAEQLFQMSTGFMVTAALHAALKLGIAELLQPGPQRVAALARATGTNEDALYRALRALATTGFFEERSPRTFAQTPISELLCADRPQSARGMLMWLSHPLHF
jgi:Dimerisation domain